MDARNIRTKRPSRKLDWKNLGRFTIKRVLNQWVFELDLPDTMQIHPVFHVSLLTPCSNDALPGQTQPEPQPIEVDGDETWEVEEIYDSKKTKGGWVQYLVKWTGIDAPTWEKAANLVNCAERLATFHRLYPDKPNALTSRGARPGEGGDNVTV